MQNPGLLSKKRLENVCAQTSEVRITYEFIRVYERIYC